MQTKSNPKLTHILFPHWKSIKKTYMCMIMHTETVKPCLLVEGEEKGQEKAYEQA